MPIVFADETALAWVGVISTVLLAILTAVYVAYTQRLVRAQTEPCVVVYACHDESRPSCLLVVIENVGGGVARNITFEVSDPIFIESEKNESGPFIDGIPMLVPGGTRKMIWGTSLSLRREIGDRTIHVKSKYNRIDRRDDFTGDGAFEQESILELRSFKYHDAVDSDGSRQCAKQLEKLVTILKSKKSD